MRTRFDLLNILFLLILFSGFAVYAKQKITNKAPLKDVKKQLEALAPVTLTSNLTHLPVNEIKVIKLLVEASKIMDDIFSVGNSSHCNTRSSSSFHYYKFNIAWVEKSCLCRTW